jgi:hypothetical protein
VARPLHGGTRVPRSEAVADDLDPPRAPMRPDSPQRNDRPPLSFGVGQCSSLRPARRPPLRAAHCPTFRAADSSSLRVGQFSSFPAGHCLSFRADHFPSFRAEGEESPAYRAAEIPRFARDDNGGYCPRIRAGNDGQGAGTRDEALSLRGGSSLPSRARRASSFRADHFSSFRAEGEESPVYRAAEIPRSARDDKVGRCPRIRAGNDGQCARTRDDALSLRGGSSSPSRARRASSVRAARRPSFRVDHPSSFRAGHFSSFRAVGEESPVHRVAEIPRCARDDKGGRCARIRGGNDGRCAGTRDDRSGAGTRRGADHAAPRAQKRGDSDRRQAAAQSRQTRRAGARTRET